MVREYRRNLAVTYARRYAMGQNPLFGDFGGIGGNCTNFISQCLYAGSCRMNYLPTFGWYYRSLDDRAPAWTGVEYFYRFLVREDGDGPFGRMVDPAEAEIGDVIQIGRRRQDGAPGIDYYHAMLIVGFSEGEPLVAAQSIASLDRPLSTYEYDASRFLHVDGVRSDPGEPAACFAALYDARSLQ